VTDGTLLVVLRDRFRYQHRDLGHPAFSEFIDKPRLGRSWAANR
jgi:hypothetical protein